VLIGWSAVTNSLSAAPWLMFALMFFWTPPHFWALAIKYRDDYSAASVPMLPSVKSGHAVTGRIIAYTVAVVATSLWLAPVAELGALYTASAVVLGAIFLWLAVQLWQTESPKVAMRLFTFSITYITLLFGAMAVDQLVRWGA
jgi:protoheme IX farnesyltransferase